MTDQLQHALNQYRHLWVRESLPAKTLLLKEGDIARKVYLIRSGCIRAWFNHDGKEICFEFFFEGETVSAVESFNKQVPSSYSIETVEPTAVSWINAESLALMRQHPLINTFMMDRAIDRQAAFIRHFFSFLRDTPQKRYENLLANRPQVIQRVPLQYIASYLGIQAPSLSRIRNKLAQKH